MAEFYEVDTPIVNDAYKKPSKYWRIRRGEPPVLIEGRRPPQYFWRPTSKFRKEEAPEGIVVDIELVSRVRSELERWMTDGYPGATSQTRELLEYWERSERDHPVVFCQREAAASVIFLVEAPGDYKQGLSVPGDSTSESRRAQGYEEFERLCVKMATGAGKTTVMGLLIAWSILNHRASPRDARFTDTILVLCPSVTIRERLAELDPKSGIASVYRVRDLVPLSRMPDLALGKVVVTNWHTFQPNQGNDVGGISSPVVNRGPESDRVLVDRVLGPSLLHARNILVFNDEAHHAYRLPPDEEEAEELLLSEDREEERREATVWIEGLEKVHKERRVIRAIDLSATPLIRHGDAAGRLFPWVVSDFALVDAIECGLVKIPQVPVADPTGRERPSFFNIWDWIVEEKLTPAERGGRHGAIDPDALVRHARLPIQILAADWSTTFAAWRAEASRGDRESVPPVFIIVCRDTKLAKALYEAIATPVPGEGELVKEFVNLPGRLNTVRIDSKVIAEIESGSRAAEARRMRFILDTIGKTSWPSGFPPAGWVQAAHELGVDPRVPPGRDIRCIISVGMLTEGWDARTVTHVVGLRPFKSQLLCEQVVGRALRRSQWNDLAIEEVARIFGVPFEVIPFKTGRPKTSGEKPSSVHVTPRVDRSEFELTFPRVNHYVPVVGDHLVAAWSRIPELTLDPTSVPNEVIVQGMAIDEEGRLTRSGVGRQATLGMAGLRAGIRQQEVEFRLATRLCREVSGSLTITAGRAFSELLGIVREYMRSKVRPLGTYAAIDVALYQPWIDRAFSDLLQGIGNPDSHGEVEERAQYDKGRGSGSTREVDFWTSRPVFETRKSHLNYAVADTKQWEQAAAYYLEQSDVVAAYAKNFDMGFTIPYVMDGERHDYTPDYLVRLTWEGTVVGHLVMEVKGFRDERAQLQEAAARRWASAVNREGSHGMWDYAVVYGPAQVAGALDASAEMLAQSVDGDRAPDPSGARA